MAEVTPKTVAILQSNYLPWKGYFDLINSADVFVFHDDLQYTKGDWRNRNKIKTKKGVEWISIPCGTNEHRLICDVRIDGQKWQKDHWNKIKGSYRDAPFFDEYSSFFSDVYLNREWENLSDLNQYLIKTISRDYLRNDSTEFLDSRDLHLKKTKADRVIELLEKVNASEYVSGPRGKEYLDEKEFDARGIKLTWFDYSGYPEYQQIGGDFVHGVSVIDLLFNVGDKARDYMLISDR